MAKKKGGSIELPEDAIWLRPHHIQRLFYDWQGWNFVSYLRSIKDNGVTRYDEGTLKHYQIIYDRLFLHNAPFVIVPSVDDMCRGCNVVVRKEDNCVLPDMKETILQRENELMFNPVEEERGGLRDDSLSRYGFQKVFGIDFWKSFNVCVDDASCIRYAPLKVYMPDKVIMRGIQGLADVLAEEEDLPEWLRTENRILNCEFKLMALEQAYERLRGKHGRA